MDRNNLDKELSPYLRQHASNPVHWQGWHKDVFAEAARLNRLVFLSIGYSTCHWCHVMAEESFADPEIARFLNDHFVSIKVDREERPDVDQIFMEVCLAFHGHGGWPLNLILTPERQPVFAGTYYPPRSRNGRIGLLEILQQIQDMWRVDPQKIILNAGEISAALSSPEHLTAGKQSLQKTDWLMAYQALQTSYDTIYGGFGNAPKFPLTNHYFYLMQYSFYQDNNEALEMTKNSLKKMYHSGLFDYISFGFHRYSTDRKWHIPHFEKMLYDQALLLLAYAQIYQRTQDELFRKIGRQIADYMKHHLTNSDGVFFSALDADSQGEEGKYYTWEYTELKKILSDQDLFFMEKFFSVTAEGNYLDEATRNRTGRNHFILKGFTDASHQEHWNTLRSLLQNLRDQRVPPQRDEKILTDWNALTILALAYAGGAFRDPDLLAMAKRGAHFFQTNLKNHNRIFHRFFQSHAGIDGMLDDYAFLGRAYLELYKQSGQMNYLSEAKRWTDIAIDLFWNDQGFFFSTSTDSEHLLYKRPVNLYDSALPAGNSVMLENLILLSKITRHKEYQKKAEKQMTFLHHDAQRMPSSLTRMLSAASGLIWGTYEVIVAAREDDRQADEILTALRAMYHPAMVLIESRFPSAKAANPEINGLIPELNSQPPINGKTTIYVCRNFVCQQPVFTIQEAMAVIKR